MVLVLCFVVFAVNGCEWVHVKDFAKAGVSRGSHVTARAGRKGLSYLSRKAEEIPLTSNNDTDNTDAEHNHLVLDERHGERHGEKGLLK